MRKRMALLSVLVVPALLAGCASGQAPEPKKTPPLGPMKPQVGPGTLMTDALTEARCTADGTGAWSASGVVKNTTKKALAFDVTIYVGPSDGQSRPAHVTHVDKVQAGKSAPWSAPAVEAGDPAGPCHIQVRVAK
ncbi:MAG: hypothetical protein ACJ71Z_11195 [Aeromicrobium sp.]